MSDKKISVKDFNDHLKKKKVHFCDPNKKKKIIELGLVHEAFSKINQFLFVQGENGYYDLSVNAKDGSPYKFQIKYEGGENPVVEEKVRAYLDKSDLAEQIWEVKPYFFDKTGFFWLWRSDLYKWERVDDIDILNMVSSKSDANTVNSKEKSEIIESMKQYGRKKIPLPISKNWIQFKDKVYDLRNDEEFEVSPDYMVTNPIPWEIGKSEKTPVIDQIFKEWVGEKNVRLLYEIIAYSMLPDYPLSRIFCLVGSGMNGKSKFLELLRKFVGDENSCSSELDNLLGSRFEKTRMHKKLVVLMGETNFNEMSKTSMLKQLSGGDLIGFEYKNKPHFQDVNYAKILISTNTLPATTDKTLGFYRRWVIVDFPNKFTEKKDILKDIPEPEINNLAKKCLKYLKELLKKREFHNEGTVEERMKKYEERSNPMEKFIKEYCDSSDPDAFMTKNQLSKKLNDWLKNNSYRTLSDVEITRRMRSMGFEDSRDYIDWFENGQFERKLARSWRGIKIKSNSENEM